MTDFMQEFHHWLDSPALSEPEWAELDAIKDDPEEIKSRFFAPLEFGTAGLRGIMGMGIRRMNRHVICHTTQAFANVICAEGEEAMKKGVVICYDCRENSEYFARMAATEYMSVSLTLCALLLSLALQFAITELLRE